MNRVYSDWDTAKAEFDAAYGCEWSFDVQSVYADGPNSYLFTAQDGFCAVVHESCDDEAQL